MANIVPEKLSNFRVYKEGKTNLVGIADIQLPSIEPLTETIKGAGIAGEYESPVLGHLKSMKLTLNWRTITDEQLALAAPVAHKLEARGALQVYDAGKGGYVTKSVRILVQGGSTKNELGKFEVGNTTGSNNEIESVYLKVEYDGKTKIEIDKLNFKYVIDGKDYLADIRKALGM